MENNIMADTIPCERIFSNGSEFEWFIETQCEKCTRFRNEQCRIYRACCAAMWDTSKFPYSDLLDFKDGVGGKLCKSFTTEPIKKKKKVHNCNGQLNFFNEDGDNDD